MGYRVVPLVAKDSAKLDLQPCVDQVVDSEKVYLLVGCQTILHLVKVLVVNLIIGMLKSKEEEEAEDAYTAAFGCSGLSTRNFTRCDALELAHTSWYSFRVREVCTDQASTYTWNGNSMQPIVASSDWSDPNPLSSSQTTVAGPSAPLHVTTGERAGSPIFTIVEIKTKDYVEVKTEGHTFANNDYVYINGIPDNGPKELNDKVFHVSDVNTLSFQLTNITTASIFGKFKGQVTLFDGTRSNETMSISWKPSIILCDVSNPSSLFSQFHVQYKKSFSELYVTEIRVEAYQTVSITTSETIKASDFEAGDLVLLKNIPAGGPSYLNDKQFMSIEPHIHFAFIRFIPFK